MSGSGAAPASSRYPGDVPAGSRRPLERAQWRQLAWITAAALALFVVLRLLPTGTNLSHMDFRVDPKGGAALEFCDPSNPQFIPVVAVRSPVVMNVRAERPPVAGQELRGVVTLETASGKAIAPEDLLVTHTRRLHLLIVDPTLTDYQHVHPQPRGGDGAWEFSFTPRASGAYRIFADFTPAATGRGLYASADLEVGQVSDLTLARPAGSRPPKTGQVEDLTYSLTSSATPIRDGQPAELKLAITRRGGGAVPLEPVMGAFAHLVAIDETRSGFAHLHPGEADLAKRPDAARPELTFKLTIPNPGRYVIWAQLNLAGEDVFVPFWIEVK